MLIPYLVECRLSGGQTRAAHECPSHLLQTWLVVEAGQLGGGLGKRLQLLAIPDDCVWSDQTVGEHANVLTNPDLHKAYRCQ